MASSIDVQFDHLAETIVEWAQRVFLWVYLVVLFLCDGIINGDNVDLVQARLGVMSADLEIYFYHMLQSMEGAYIRKMAEVNQVILQSCEPLTVISLSFLEHRYSNSSDFALNLPIEPIDKHEISNCHVKMKHRIRGRYNGLLEVTAEP